MPLSRDGQILAIVAPIIGILLAVEGLLFIPAFGLLPGSAGSKAGLYTVIGSIGLIGGVLYLASSLGLWKVRKWGWNLAVVASGIEAVYTLWASINVLNALRPLVEFAIVILVLGYLVKARSSFRPAAARPQPGP